MVALLLSRTFACSLRLALTKSSEWQRHINKDFDLRLNRVLGSFALASSYLTLLPIQGINFPIITTTEITLNFAWRGQALIGGNSEVVFLPAIAIAIALPQNHLKLYYERYFHTI